MIVNTLLRFISFFQLMGLRPQNPTSDVPLDPSRLDGVLKTLERKFYSKQ